MDADASPRSRRLMAALWPSFLTAGVLETLVLSVIDPAPLIEASSLSSSTVYTLAFLCFWAVTGLSSGLSLWLANPPPSR
jgi:hypothetical protein